MTYNECVKKLADFAKCKYLGEGCDDCFFGEEKDECIIYLCHCAHFLINHQQAEIERYRTAVPDLEYLDEDFCGLVCRFAEGLIEKGKAKAVKEFAESVERYKTGIFINGVELIIIPVSDLEKMVGEFNAAN